MADIRAFRAYRYDLGRVGALSDVVAPPYDVIDPALQQALYDRSPYNVIRLILNKEQPGDNERDNRYTRAAGFLRDWQADDVLVQDSARSLYVYHQDFEVEGRATRAAASWPASAWSRSARAASTPTRRRWPAPRPTASSCSTPRP